MRYALVCILALASWFGCAAQQNILLIIADDLSPDYLGIYQESADTATTPRLRGLYQQGVLFQNAWGTPLCSPTRAGLLTGRYSFRTGVGTALSGPADTPLDTSEISLGKLLKGPAPQNYATANVGKWHLNQQTPQNLSIPNQMGYDFYAGNFLGEIPNYYNWKKVVNGAAAVTVTNYATTETVDDAIAWLQTLDDSQPFFLWTAFNAPHTPFHKPPDNLHTVPGLIGTQGHINQNPRLYFKAMLQALDTETGRLLDWLDTSGRLDSTHIIFIGDNGNAKRVAQIADTTHAKGTIYEYGLRVPMVIAGPAVQNPGRRSDALVSTTDLFATILEMAGFEQWQNAIPDTVQVDARSLMPLLKNTQEKVRDWNFSEVFGAVAGADDGKTMRDTTYKLLAPDGGPQEFYQLSADPQETNNLLLQLPLDADAAAHYVYLCQQMSQLTGGNYCNALVAAPVLADSDTGLQVYPNPVGATRRMYLYDAPENLQALQYRLSDMTGRWWRSGNYMPAEGINMEYLPAGSYLLWCTRSGHSRVLRVVVW